MNHVLRGALPLGLVLLSSPLLFAHDGDPKLLDKEPMYPGRGWRSAERQNPDGSVNGSEPAITFPASNVTLLSWLSLADFGMQGGNGNSCYGYTSPSGREYAIMGLSTGTAFVEITHPGDAVVVAQVPGPHSLWRDVKTHGATCYAVSEGGGGIQVMDLSSIDSGIVTTHPSVDDDGTPATHTLAVDNVSGFLYRSGGGSQGLRIYDLANPQAPVRVGTWSTKYVHEPQIVTYTSGPAAGKQIAYCCGGFNGGFSGTGIDVLDVTNKAAIVFYGTGHYQWSGAQYAHQAWLSPDRTRLYLNDELDEQWGGALCLTQVFDASNPAALVRLAPFTNNNTATGHNLYTKDDRIYESNYRSGLRVFSTSSPGTPNAPVEVGYFDTYPGSDANRFNGLWNNYPYFQSGLVIGSDIEKGLFVWWVGTPMITFQLPNGAPETISPAGQNLRVHLDESFPGAIVPGTAKVHIDTGTGYVASDLVPAGGDYDAVFPPTTCGTLVSYYFTAQSTNGVLWSEPQGAPRNVYTTVPADGLTVVASDDFEANQGWTASVSGATGGQWQRGVPIDDPSWAYDPPADADGSGQCYLTQNQAGNTDVDGGAVILTSPVLDLVGGADIRYAYWLSLSAVDGIDNLVVEANNNAGAGGWTTIAAHTTDGAGAWRENVIPASTITDAGLFFGPLMRFRFVANDGGAASVVEAGIDAFEARRHACFGTALFCYGDGTSGPCPCGNDGAPGKGCENSSFTGGAVLTMSGAASVSADSLVLTASEEKPTAFSLFLQGSVEIVATNFGDGLRCAGGSLKRLYSRNAVGGTVTAPQGAEPSITARSAALGDTIPANGTRIYHVYYRDAVVGFCDYPPGSTFNASSGLRVLWAP